MKLKELREKAGFSQRELAEKLGVQASTVCQWESGKREPNMALVKRIASILSCTADELLGIDHSAGEGETI